MNSFKVEFIDGSEVVRSLEVAAQSDVHAVMKTVPRPLKPGRELGKQWIRVTDSNQTVSEFQVVGDDTRGSGVDYCKGR